MTALADRIAAVVTEADLGRADALKRGRCRTWPYVPVVLHQVPALDRERTEPVLRFAFRTRAEAVDFAERTITHRREALARKLADPRYRALRQQFGLPRDIEAVSA